VMLIAYSLLPEHLRFSRALIILGSIYTMISLTILRYILNLSKLEIFNTKNTQFKRIGIVAENKEFKRIKEIIKTVHPKIKFIGKINNQIISDDALGNINQIEEIMKIHKLNEVIFSSKDINANEIIYHMGKIPKNISIKIAPSESTFIIGSNSIHTQGDLYVVKNNIKNRSFIKRFFQKYIDFFN